MTKAIDVHCHLSTRPQYEAWGPYVDAMERYYKFRPDVRSETEMAEDLRVNQVTPGPWTETLGDFELRPVRGRDEDTLREFAAWYAGTPLAEWALSAWTTHPWVVVALAAFAVLEGWQR